MIRKVLKITETKFTLVIFIGFSFIISILELISTAMLISLADFIQSESITIPAKILNYLEILNIKVNEIYYPEIKIVILTILIFFILKNLLIVLLKKIQIDLIYINQKTLSVLILNLINKASYLNFSKKKAETYTNIFINDISQITNAGLSSVISLINESFIIIILWSSLMIVYPSETLVILVFYIPVTFLVTRIISNLSKKLGDERQKYEIKILELLNSFFLSFKEVKIYSLGKNIVDDFSKIKTKAISIASWNSLIQQLNKYIIEIQIIVSVTIISVYLDYNFDNIRNFLIAFLFVSIKIIPSLSIFMTAFSNLKYAEASYKLTSSTINQLDEEKKINTNKKNIFSNQGQIILKNVSFSYDNKVIIKKFNHTFNSGSKTLIIGKSGIGKTTLFNLICKLIKPNQGSILLPKGGNNNISYCTQSPFIFNETISRNIHLNNILDKELMDYSIEFSLLNDFIKKYDMGINELLRNNGKNISGGQLKRIALARAIYASRDILLLDEVTNGLDLNTKTKILLNLMKSEKTVILISHDEDIKHYFNNIIDFNEIHKG